MHALIASQVAVLSITVCICRVPCYFRGDNSTPDDEGIMRFQERGIGIFVLMLTRVILESRQFDAVLSDAEDERSNGTSQQPSAVSAQVSGLTAF